MELGNSENDDGAYPSASLIFDKWGNLYGTTNNGGSAGSALFVDGTVFELSPPVSQQSQWSERLLWSFIGEPAPGFNLAFPDGEGPSASLILISGAISMARRAAAARLVDSKEARCSS